MRERSWQVIKSKPKRARGAKSVDNHLVDLLILFRVVIYLFILYDLPTNTV